MFFVLLIIYSAIYLGIIKCNLLFFCPGKCSHGGLLDKTRKRDPVGGINKDSFTSDHGTLHKKAANLAVDATMDAAGGHQTSCWRQELLAVREKLIRDILALMKWLLEL